MAEKMMVRSRHVHPRAKWSRWLTLAAAGLLLAGSSDVRAEMASDKPAAIVIFPKVVTDLTNGMDTLVRLSNVSTSPLQVLCFLLDATPRCEGGTGSCLVDVDDPSRCTGLCIDQWNQIDFRINLTSRQPIGWRISQGMRDCRSTIDPDQPCFQLDGIVTIGPGGQSNSGSLIPPASTDPFVGYLQCLVVDETGAPVERNDLQGEALIVQTGAVDPTKVDVEGYNGIGLQAIPGTNNRDGELCLGGCQPGRCNIDTQQSCFIDLDCPDGQRCSVQCVPDQRCPTGAEYNGCPNILILDHFFDGAVDPISQLPVVTDLTLVPCTQDYVTRSPENISVQFLVFNEFEQRLSTAIFVKCFKETQLTDIDTRNDQNIRSIFSAAVTGTMTGQTRIRGVSAGEGSPGNALLGVAREYRCDPPPATALTDCALVSTVASNLHSQGRRPQADLISLPGN